MKIRCLVCGATNKVTVEYSVFDPAKEDSIEAKCAACGTLLQKITCYRLSVEVVKS